MHDLFLAVTFLALVTGPLLVSLGTKRGSSTAGDNPAQHSTKPAAHGSGSPRVPAQA